MIKVEDLQLDHQGREEEEKERIKRVLEQVGGNKSLAAKVLGIHRTTLWRKMREYGLENLV